MKRLQVIFTNEAWSAIESLSAQVNENFDVGHINYSDIVNEMVLTSKVDIKALQIKHTDIKRSLKSLASQKDLDIEQVIKALMDLKGKVAKKKTNSKQEVNNA
jgi:hypothetical protein